MKNLTKRLLLLAVLGALATTAACGKNSSVPASASQVEAKNVLIHTVKRSKAVHMSEVSGSLQPSEDVTVSFEIAGRIVDLPLSQGDSVKAGDLLARLDTSDYALSVAKADTAIAQIEASLEQQNNGALPEEIAQSKANVDKEQITSQKAQDDFKRMESLYQQNLISTSDYENAKNKLATAQQDLLNAQQSYALVLKGARPEQRKSMQANYESAVVGREQAELSLSKAQLKSPMDGTIIEKLSSRGQLVNTGSPIYRVGNIDTLKIVLPVPDSEISSWQTGNSITLSLYGTSREGKVTRIYPSTNQSTGTIGVEVSVNNPKHDWFPGQVVKADRQLEGKEGLYVPVQAVISQGDTPYVFVYENGKAVKKQVSIGELTDNKLEILAGLQEGVSLIVKGADRLSDGDPVQVTEGSKS